MKLLSMFLILFSIFMFNSCKSITSDESSTTQDNFNPESVKSLIAENGKLWTKALKSQDIKLIDSIYDENAHYLPDGDNAFHGREKIAAYWKSFFGTIQEISLSMESLEGTKDLLYETGTGITDSTFKFKYTNVWKLQKNGSYKIVIDTYNDIKK